MAAPGQPLRCHLYVFPFPLYSVCELIKMPSLFEDVGHGRHSARGRAAVCVYGCIPQR